MLNYCIRKYSLKDQERNKGTKNDMRYIENKRCQIQITLDQ